MISFVILNDTSLSSLSFLIMRERDFIFYGLIIHYISWSVYTANCHFPFPVCLNKHHDVLLIMTLSHLSGIMHVCGSICNRCKRYYYCYVQQWSYLATGKLYSEEEKGHPDLIFQNTNLWLPLFLPTFLTHTHILAFINCFLLWYIIQFQTNK